MTIYYQLLEHETIQGFVKFKRLTSEQKRTIILIGVAGFLLVVYGLQLPHRRAEKFIMLGSIIVSISASLMIITPWLIRRAITRYVQNNSELFTAPYTLTFDKEKLSFSSPNIKQELAWTIFKKLGQDEQYIYLQSGNSEMMSMIPKRAFDEAGLREFLNCSHSLQQA